MRFARPRRRPWLHTTWQSCGGGVEGQEVACVRSAAITGRLAAAGRGRKAAPASGARLCRCAACHMAAAQRSCLQHANLYLFGGKTTRRGVSTANACTRRLARSLAGTHSMPSGAAYILHGPTVSPSIWMRTYPSSPQYVLQATVKRSSARQSVHACQRAHERQNVWGRGQIQAARIQAGARHSPPGVAHNPVALQQRKRSRSLMREDVLCEAEPLHVVQCFKCTPAPSSSPNLLTAGEPTPAVAS